MLGFSGKGNNILAGLEKSHSDNITVWNSVDELFIILENVMLLINKFCTNTMEAPAK